MPEQASPAAGAGIQHLSVPCGRVLGIPIRLHVLLPLAAVLAGLSAAGLGWLAVVLAVLVSGPLLLVTVLIHELGHVLAARKCGLSADHILLWPLGGLAFIGGTAAPKAQMFISASGPATHLPMLGLWALLLFLLHGHFTLSYSGFSVNRDFLSLLCIAMLNSNLAMLCFNLLVPCFPLDCSRILASLLLLGGFEPGRAAGVIVACSILALIVIVLLIVWSYVESSTFSSLNLVLAVWLGMQTWRLHRSRQQGDLVNDPLFGAAMAGQAAANPAEAAQTAPGRFRPFDGGAMSLGKATAPASQVCIGAAIAIWVAVDVSRAGMRP